MADLPQAKQNKYVFSPVPSLLALALGLIIGIAANQTELAALLAIQDLVLPIGQLWLRALQMTVFPLVIANLVVAILSTSDTKSFGRLGAGTLVLFVLALVAGGVFTLTVGAAAISLLTVDPNAGQSLASLSDQAAELAMRAPEHPSFSNWLVELVPVNPFTAMSEGQLLPVLVFTVFFALALTKVSRENRVVAERFFRAMSEAMLVLVGWILIATPVGVFALSASIATGLGTTAVTVLAQYLVLIIALLVAGTVLLYPITAALGGESISRFAKGVLPAQIVAVSTRSSLASLPALLNGARNQLNVKPEVANLTLPLAVSVFKVNRTISATLKVLLIAHLFSIDISTAQIVTFVTTIIILSFSAVGIPLGGGSMKTLPAYLAVGIPLEAYILFKAVESIPDIFKTVLNVTGDMSVAVIANRWFGKGFARATEENSALSSSIAKPVLDRTISVPDEH